MISKPEAQIPCARSKRSMFLDLSHICPAVSPNTFASSSSWPVQIILAVLNPVQEHLHPSLHCMGISANLTLWELGSSVWFNNTQHKQCNFFLEVGTSAPLHREILHKNK